MSISALAQDAVRPQDKAAPNPVATAARARGELNVSIVQASLTVAIGAGNDSLALLYKSAITSINEELKADFGDNALQNALGQDNTPEGTAGRIVSLSTAFYGAYLQQNKLEDNADSRKAFVDTIRSGVERGFKEARDILQGLKVLEGDIATNIDKTYDLVQQGLDAFLNPPEAE